VGQHNPEVQTVTGGVGEWRYPSQTSLLGGVSCPLYGAYPVICACSSTLNSYLEYGCSLVEGYSSVLKTMKKAWEASCKEKH